MTEEGLQCFKHCHRNGIQVYPVHIRGSWYLEVNNNGKKRRGQKVISTNKVLRWKELSPALEATYKYYSDKLKNL